MLEPVARRPQRKDSAPGFSFLELHQRTPGLPAAERMATFFELPSVLQRQAWDDLAERMDHVTALDWRDWIGDDR